MSPETYREMAQLERLHWWFIARRIILRNILKSLPLPTAPKILEFGCGTGGNLDMLCEFGEVTAVEMNEFARQHAQKHSGCRVLSGYLPNHLPELPEHDLVCLFDVLEHIPDDLAALQSLHQLVKPGGHLVLTVPAYQWLWGSHDVAHHHQRRYCAGKLRTLTNQAGWRIQRLGYFNTWLLPLVVLHRIKQRLFSRHDSGSDMHLPVAWINFLLQHIFASEAFWLRRHTFPCGLSMLAVLERR